jgi:hypothetical protein
MRRTIVTVLSLLACGAVSVDGQQPDWPLGWSPLARAELPRSASGALHTWPGLLGPPPRIGAFWSGRNPAALPWEVGASYGELSARRLAVDGEYRRPLEAPAATTSGAAAIGWQPVGERAAMIGHASFDEARVESGLSTIETRPYSGTPFVVLDSTTSGLRSTQARLEGAGGWSIGNLGLGIALGYEAVDASTQTSRVPRFTRAARPAVTLGIAHRLADGAATAGAYVRWNRDDATVQILANPGLTLVTRLNGFAAPARTPLAPGLGVTYYRRREAGTRAAGATVAGSTRGWAWTAYGEAAGVQERSWTRQAADPPMERWNARGVMFGAQSHGAVGSGLLLMLHADGTSTSSDARLADPDSIIYRSTESAVRTAAELRWAPDAAAWQARGGAAITYEKRDRGDTTPNVLRTRIESLTTRLHGEAAITVMTGVQLAGGYALTSYAPRGSIPGPQSYPPSLWAVLAPETAVYATRNTAHAVTLGINWDVRSTTSLRMSGGYESLTPLTGGTVLELVPQGERKQWSIAAGVVIR